MIDLVSIISETLQVYHHSYLFFPLSFYMEEKRKEKAISCFSFEGSVSHPLSLSFLVCLGV
jgi:hypothetical protein